MLTTEPPGLGSFNDPVTVLHNALWEKKRMLVTTMVSKGFYFFKVIKNRDRVIKS